MFACSLRCRAAEEGGAEVDPVAELLKQAERAQQMLIWHSQVRGRGSHGAAMHPMGVCTQMWGSPPT